MTETSIKIIEKELGITLPEQYKKIIINHPFANKESYNYVETLLLNNEYEIIELNNKLRINGFQNQKWPESFFIIGYGKAEESYYFLNLKNKKGIIFCADLDRKYNPQKIGHLKSKDNIDKYIKVLKMLQSAGEAK